MSAGKKHNPVALTRPAVLTDWLARRHRSCAGARPPASVGARTALRCDTGVSFERRRSGAVLEMGAPRLQPSGLGLALILSLGTLPLLREQASQRRFACAAVPMFVCKEAAHVTRKPTGNAQLAKSRPIGLNAVPLQPQRNASY